MPNGACTCNVQLARKNLTENNQSIACDQKQILKLRTEANPKRPTKNVLKNNDVWCIALVFSVEVHGDQR